MENQTKKKSFYNNIRSYAEKKKKIPGIIKTHVINKIYRRCKFGERERMEVVSLKIG
jgi:hypothetical protein